MLKMELVVPLCFLFALFQRRQLSIRHHARTWLKTSTSSSGSAFYDPLYRPHPYKSLRRLCLSRHSLARPHDLSLL
uniref:Secreted protein n=1 Tax=Mycena chlorophos TaxID=658473 RepID=A0ABQ0LF59_MYCCL|nr:predicted protein [Mycena chlorophos]